MVADSSVDFPTIWCHEQPELQRDTYFNDLANLYFPQQTFNSSLLRQF